MRLSEHAMSPGDYLVQKQIENPHASAPLIVPVLVVRNTPAADIERNIRVNAGRDDLQWIGAKPAHETPLVIVGGGPSAAEHLDEIRARQAAGAHVFALNAASLWLSGAGIKPDAQIIVDAQQATAAMVDLGASGHLFGSQVHPDTMNAAPQPWVWHMGEDCEAFLPPSRRARGGYALIGGGAAVGTCAACLAYTLGYRSMHLYGYDSSHRSGRSHAYTQPQNDLIPTIDVDWAGKTYTASVVMKAQAEWFQVIGRGLRELGCAVEVHGDGLLPAMFNTPADRLSERDKYRLMWQMAMYRAHSPGEEAAETFLRVAKPEGLVVDFGCGTGRGALKIKAAGVPVFLIDFADNARDFAAQGLPFLCHDLTQPVPVSGAVGFCTDVMEHIPGPDIDRVLGNIFDATPRVFFSIGTTPDCCGLLIGATLHVSVMPHEAWAERLARFGRIAFEHKGAQSSLFYVEKE